jgi:hypothetical protein
VFVVRDAVIDIENTLRSATRFVLLPFVGITAVTLLTGNWTLRKYTFFAGFAVRAVGLLVAAAGLVGRLVPTVSRRLAGPLAVLGGELFDGGVHLYLANGCTFGCPG